MVKIKLVDIARILGIGAQQVSIICKKQGLDISNTDDMLFLIESYRKDKEYKKPVDLMTISEAVKYTGRTRQAMSQALKRGRLTKHRLGGKMYVALHEIEVMRKENHVSI